MILAREHKRSLKKANNQFYFLMICIFVHSLLAFYYLHILKLL